MPLTTNDLMTESEWQRAACPSPMLEFLVGKATRRKLLLFNCACCRRIEHLLTDPRSRKIIEVAEAFVDGSATDQQFHEAGRAAADAALEDEHSAGAQSLLRYAAYVIPLTDPSKNYPMSASHARGGLAFRPGPEFRLTYEPDEEIAEAEERQQAALVREIFGNPFRPLPHIGPSGLPPAVIGLAKTIYDERAFGRMAELGLALKAAGCNDAELLGHPRSEGPHVRGCWVVDLLLGKQ